MSGLPDLGGTWALHGVTLGPDGGTLYEWDAELTLTPLGEAFGVAIETAGFKSGYEADPEHGATAGHPFFGISQLTFAADGRSATGSSCDYNGRYVVMELALRRG